MSRHSDTVLARHYLVRPLGDATPATKRGRKFDLADHEGARACYVAAVEAGHQPTIALYSKTISPCSRTPRRHEEPVHVDRIGHPVEGRDRHLLGRPLDWPAYRSVHVTLGGGRLHAAGVWDASGVVDRVRWAVYRAQPYADVIVKVAGTDPRYPAPHPVADGPMTHVYVVVRADGTTGNQDDADLWLVMDDALRSALWSEEDALDRNARCVEVGIARRSSERDFLAFGRAVKDALEAAYPAALLHVHRSREDFVTARDPEVRAAVEVIVRQAWAEAEAEPVPG